MPRTAHQRHIHFKYNPAFIELYDSQSAEFKSRMAEIGRPNGYSPMNVFYTFLCRYMLEYFTGTAPGEYKKTGVL